MANEICPWCSTAECEGLDVTCGADVCATMQAREEWRKELGDAAEEMVDELLKAELALQTLASCDYRVLDRLTLKLDVTGHKSFAGITFLAGDLVNLLDGGKNQ